MIKNAADEYGSAKIRFNVLQPGFITIEAMAPIERGSAVWSSYRDQTPRGDDICKPDSLRRGTDCTLFVHHPRLDRGGPA